MKTKEERLIVQYNRSRGLWEDVTEKIQWIKNDGNAYCIKYNSSNTFYHKSFSDIKIYEHSQIIDITELHVYHNGVLFGNILKVLRFNEWCKVYFANGNSKIYKYSELKFVKELKNQPQIKEILAYLGGIARLLSVDGDTDFLSKQIENISVKSDSILGKFFSDNLNKVKLSSDIIYPFATNVSQSEAVKKALTNDLSIIQGPPGTGKTQTILNIVANFVNNGKCVAVLSGNNKATQNVYDKLISAGYGSINAFLGNRENIDKFFADLKPVPLERSVDCSNQINRLRTVSGLIDQYKSYEEEIQRLSCKIEDYSAEKQVNDAEYNAVPHMVPEWLKNRCFSSSKLLELASFLELLTPKKITHVINRIRLLFKFGIRNVNEIVRNLNDVIEYLKNKYYAQKISELKLEKEQKEAFLSSHNIVQLKEEVQNLSKYIFKNSINEKLLTLSSVVFTKGDYKFNFSEFQKRYPVIYSTTHAILSCSGKGAMYDCVIIDESSQVDLVTAVIAFSCARQVVLVGDDKQLTHIVQNDIREKAEALFLQNKIDGSYNYCKNNILCSVLSRKPEIPQTLLNEHFRCDPQIIGFCNKRFYNNQLIIKTIHSKGSGVTIISHGSHFERNRTNEREADIIEQEILPDLKGKDIGVMAPYRNQVDLLTEKFEKEGCIVDTVHRFQGRENDYIILSTVANKIRFYEDDEKIDFINNENLINVAISRAKKRLFILASEDVLTQPNSLLNDLNRYYSYYCNETKVIKSSVYSVFDLMYDDYLPILESLKKKLLKISRYESENIIATVLKDVFQSRQHRQLSFKFNYPLKYVIKSLCCESEADKKFLDNIHTHCDFLIFNKLDKSVELVIEIDGSQHAETLQKERDERKDRLLRNAGIRVLRLKTTEINCKEKIIEMLSKNS